LNSRAVISDLRILILDEATAALDVQNKGTVQLALEEASHGRTTICITRKPKEAMKTDNVLVLSPNGVEEHGTPKDLVKLGGPFAKFITSEMKDESNTSIEGQLHTTKKTPTYELNTEIVLNEQLDTTSPITDHSLIYCMAIILYRQRQHWRWMIALLTPCLLGGE
jgi:ABC-type multidrug transport system ATPase subunit